ncbi:Fic family protein [Streptococcus cristatus]|nr:Fic family protein [Streptococcus cristatus]
MKTGEGNKRGISITRRKAANLLYFLIKDHPFVYGCKRIAASIFWNF